MAKRELHQTLKPEEMDLVEDFKESSRKKINEKITIPGLGELTCIEEFIVTPIGEKTFKGSIIVKKGVAKEPKGTEIFTCDEMIDGKRVANQTIAILPDDGPAQLIFNFLAPQFEPKMVRNWLLISRYNVHKAGQKEIRLLAMVHSTKPPALAFTDILNYSVKYISRNMRRAYVCNFSAKGMVVHFLKLVGSVVAKMTKVSENIGAAKMTTDEKEAKDILEWTEVIV